MSRVSVLFVVTVTVAAPTIVTMPSFAVPDESVNVGVPNEYPVGGGDGSVGSVIVHTVPVGIPLIVTEPPADTDGLPVPNAPQS